MGLLFNRKPNANQVRPDQVRRLVAAIVDYTDASDLVDIEHPDIQREFSRAEAVLRATYRNSTTAEIRAADQLARHYRSL